MLENGLEIYRVQYILIPGGGKRSSLQNLWDFCGSMFSKEDGSREGGSGPLTAGDS